MRFKTLSTQQLADMFLKLGAAGNPRMDSGTMYVARDLTDKKLEAIRDKYGKLKAFELANLVTDTAAGATHISVIRLSDKGFAEVIANYSDDLPIVSVESDDNLQPVFTVGAAYQVSEEDTMPLPGGSELRLDVLEERSRAAHDAVMRKIDEICMIGIPSANLSGFLNSALVTLVVLTTGNWANPATTNAEILADLRQLESAIINLNLEQSYPDKLVIPNTVAERFTENAGTGTDSSIWEQFKRNSRSVQEAGKEWSLVPTFFANSVAGTQRATMYDSEDSQTVKCEVPLLPTEIEPTRKNLVEIFPVIARTGGTQFMRPAQAAYATVG